MTYKTALLPAFALSAGLAMAGAAYAGPIGSGLSLTEEIARKELNLRTVKVAHSTTCAADLHAALSQKPEVVKVKSHGAGVEVTFSSKEHAAAQDGSVRALVASACTAARS